MTEKQKNELKGLAKGHWQDSILSDLLAGRTITSPIGQIKGRARGYIGRYQESFYNLLSRLNIAGVIVVRTPGIRGGEYSATYKIVF